MTYTVLGVTLNLAQSAHTDVHFPSPHPVLLKCTRKMLILSHIIQPVTHCGNEVRCCCMNGSKSSFDCSINGS